MANIDPCPVCGVNRLMTGYSHRCIARPAPTPKPSLPKPSATKPKRVRAKPAEAKAGSAYRYRDADKRRAYQRELMRKIRAKDRK